MAIQFGNDKIKAIYVGSDAIKKVYYGSDLVWDGTAGYWVHKDTGVKTYFGLDDPSISGSIVYVPSWRYDCSEVRIPYGVTGLYNGCFSNCTSLTSITLPKSVTRLYSSCLGWCTSLTSINIPESVIYVGGYCFSGSTSLTSINIPESVTSIGVYCFRDCSSLTLLTALPVTPPTLGSGAFDGVDSSFNIKVRSPYVNAYKTAPGWSDFADKISAI